jgi:histidinol-phosphatase (PHP family)
LNALREAYKDRIKIHIGFEMECYPKYFDEMLQNARNYGAEYLILGQHFLGSEHPDGQSATTMTRDPAQLTEYVDCVVRGIESGVFTYVAHPDMINFAGEEAIYITKMQRICDASIACNVPLEINLLGIRGSRRYPRKLFWELAGKTQVPVTIGSDAHDPQNVYDPDSLAVAKQWIAEFNLNYIGKAPLINPNKKSR